MREIEFRYKIEGMKELLYDHDERFGYMQQKRKMIAGSDGDLFFIESEMQFTGLKDKNGVKIFEGDVLKSHMGNRIVKWSSTSVSNGWSMPLIHKHPIYNYSEVDLKIAGGILEVIGNIHQSPELLKEGN